MPQTVHSLLLTLRARPASSAPQLAQALGTSVPTVQRLLRRAGNDVLTLGQARRTRHAARRALRGDMTPLPVHRIDAHGTVQPFGTLALIAPDGAAMPLASSGWPVPAKARDGWWDGLPYPLQDMRPQGYLGRQFAHALAELLQLPADPRAWSDDDTLVALSIAGADTVGDLVVGAPALRHWQAARQQNTVPVAPAERAHAYVECAHRALMDENPRDQARRANVPNSRPCARSRTTLNATTQTKRAPPTCW